MPAKTKKTETKTVRQKALKKIPDKVQKKVMVKTPVKKKPTKEVMKQSIYEKYPELKTVIANVVLTGDISQLNSPQRVMYYNAYCESLQLNPLTKPFDIIELSGKTILYPNKECAAQLRELHQISIDSIHVENLGDIYMVVVNGHDKNGKTDCDVGAVAIGGLKGEALANRIMKATTKAKRRLTLSIAGLGGLDETEIENIKNMEQPDVEPTEIDMGNLRYKSQDDSNDEKKPKVVSGKAKLVVFVREKQKEIMAAGIMPSSLFGEAKGKTDEEIDDIIKRMEEKICQKKTTS